MSELKIIGATTDGKVLVVDGDAHCVVCGSDPKWFMSPGATWPQGVIHSACRPIYEARQREAVTEVT